LGKLYDALQLCLRYNSPIYQERCNSTRLWSFH